MNLEPAAAPRRSLAGARWIVVAVPAILLLVAFVQVRGVLQHRGAPTVGDGQHVETYGFDLTHLAIPRRLLVAGGLARDGLHPLVAPHLLTVAGVDSLNHAERGKYLVSDDLVIGVVVNGYARAYPLRVMNWHEVADDTLGGRAIAACWHPLSGSVVVLDRRHGDTVLDLGVSGLLYDSHHLLYDRRDDGGEPSLWAPLLAQAVSGPAVGDTLPMLPHALTSWGAWRKAYPRTTVPLPLPTMRASYNRMPYGSYESTDVLRFPVAPLPPVPAGLGLKSMLELVPTSDGGWAATPRPELHATQVWAAEVPGGVVAVRLARAHAFWFAWQALRGTPERIDVP